MGKFFNLGQFSNLCHGKRISVRVRDFFIEFSGQPEEFVRVGDQRFLPRDIERLQTSRLFNGIAARDVVVLPATHGRAAGQSRKARRAVTLRAGLRHHQQRNAYRPACGPGFPMNRREIRRFNNLSAHDLPTLKQKPEMPTVGIRRFLTSASQRAYLFFRIIDQFLYLAGPAHPIQRLRMPSLLHPENVMYTQTILTCGCTLCRHR